MIPEFICAREDSRSAFPWEACRQMRLRETEIFRPFSRPVRVKRRILLETGVLVNPNGRATVIVERLSAVVCVLAVLRFPGWCWQSAAKPLGRTALRLRSKKAKARRTRVPAIAQSILRSQQCAQKEQSPDRTVLTTSSFCVADLNFPWLRISLAKTGGLAGSITQVEQLGSTDASVSSHFDVSNLGGVHWE